MKDSSRHKLAENEVIFRDANTNMAEFIEETEGKNTKTKLPFYCECSNRDCRERIKLIPKEYKSCHLNKRQFIAIASHEIPEIEKIVAKKDYFNVIEKFGDPPDIEQIDSALRIISIS